MYKIHIKIVLDGSMDILEYTTGTPSSLDACATKLFYAVTRAIGEPSEFEMNSIQHMQAGILGGKKQGYEAISCRAVVSYRLKLTQK